MDRSGSGLAFHPLPKFTEKAFFNLPYLGALNAALKREWLPEYAPYLFIGKTGIGKTHLLATIARDILARDPQKRIAFFTAEQFLEDFGRAFRQNKICDFSEAVSRCDVLIIDDVTSLQMPLEANENESRLLDALHIFLHDRINQFRDAGKLMFFSSTVHPDEFRGHSRITSRLLSGFTHVIDNPGEEDLSLAIQMNASARGLTITDERLQAIVPRLKPDFREVESIVNLLETEMRIPDSGDLIEKFFGTRPNQKFHRTSFLDVVSWVAQKASEEPNNILSKKRKHSIAVLRHLATYLAVAILEKPRKQVMLALKNDHATVIYALKTIDTRLKKGDRFITQLVDQFKKEWNTPN